MTRIRVRSGIVACAVLTLAAAGHFLLSPSIAPSPRGPQGRPPYQFVDEQGAALESLFQGAQVRAVAGRPKARHGSAPPCAARSRTSVLDRALGWFTPRTVLAQTCYDEVPNCYDHYAYVYAVDCNPACYGLFSTYYICSNMAPYSNGEYENGTEGCTPLCSPVCNYA